MPNASGKVDLAALLKALGTRGINELHVEAGGKLNGSLLREGCIDELLLYMAPSLLGDAQSIAELAPIDDLAQAIKWRFYDVDRVGEDIRILARRL